MYKCVIFDLDGTLLDTLEDLADSVNLMLEKFSCPQRSLEEIRQFVGNGMKKLVERSVPESFDKNNLNSAYEFFREAYIKNMQNKTLPYNGIAECLDELKHLGIKSAVTSNKNDDAVKNLCKEYFGEFIGHLPSRIYINSYGGVYDFYGDDDLKFDVKSKNKKVGTHQTKKLMQKKRNH